MKNMKKIIFAMIAVFFITSLLVPIAGIFADTSPEVYAKKSDYEPDKKVMIFGNGFLPEEPYAVVVVGPDNGSSMTVSETICTNKTGDFKYKYQLQDISDDFNPVGTYNVTVFDSDGNAVAGTTFTDGTVRWW